MRRTSRGAGCRACWRQNAPKSWIWHLPGGVRSEEPKTRQKHAGCALQMPVRARGRKSPSTGPHAAELAFYLRGCDRTKSRNLPPSPRSGREPSDRPWVKPPRPWGYHASFRVSLVQKASIKYDDQTIIQCAMLYFWRAVVPPN